jgi:hypothetical protein
MVATLDERPDAGPWAIGAVGFANNLARHKHYVLLMLPNVPLVDDLRAALPPGTVLTVRDPDS